MSGVLLDNQSILEVLDSTSLYSSKRSDEKVVAFANCIYALVLWENVYYCPRRTHTSNEYKIINSINSPFIKLENIDSETIYVESAYKIAMDYFSQYQNPALQFQIQNAIYYVLLSTNHNIDVLLSKDRADFLESSDIYKFLFSRRDIISLVDKEILQLYNEINNSLDKNILKIQCPLFVDYICDNAATYKEAFNNALVLRDEPMVIDFRKAMSDMEHSLKTGNIIRFKQYIDIIPDIIHDLQSSGCKTTTINIDLSLTPSITIPYVFKKKPKQMLHVKFITELAKYGLYGKSLYDDFKNRIPPMRTF